jgi:predicted dehydrogenase
MDIAVVGFGARGAHYSNIVDYAKVGKIVAVCDVRKERLEMAKEKYNVPDENLFTNTDEFFKAGKFADLCIVATQDAQHREHAIKAMEIGYNLLLEKPIATNLEDVMAIYEASIKYNKKVSVCHVLRYAPFYSVIKDELNSGKYGKIVTMDLAENVGYWHQAHSFVRGHWRNKEQSSPMIIAKCCHDLDIIKWLMDKKCTAISSFGSLFHYKPENAPKGSAEWCVDCDEQTKANCLYNAYRIYPERMKQSVVGGTARLVGSDIYEVLDKKKDIIAKCVYHAGNDAIDNQVVNMLFEDGSTAHLTMSAFSQNCYRYIKVHGTKGEIYGDAESGVLYLHIFGEEQQKINIADLVNDNNANLADGHGGGDYFLYKDFVDYITDNNESFTRTTIDESIESHLMGFKAEESRLVGGELKQI